MAYLIHNVLPVPPRQITYITSEVSVKSCIEQMTDLNIGALVVVDAKKKLIGIVSERDVLRECLYKGLNADSTKASQIVYQNVTILSSRDTVESAMKAITDTKRRHILIQEGDELIAIISIGDLMYHLLEDKARVIEHLENYIYS